MNEVDDWISKNGVTKVRPDPRLKLKHMHGYEFAGNHSASKMACAARKCSIERALKQKRRRSKANKIQRKRGKATPTEKQINFLNKFKIPHKPDINFKQAYHLISKFKRISKAFRKIELARKQLES